MVAKINHLGHVTMTHTVVAEEGDAERIELKQIKRRPPTRWVDETIIDGAMFSGRPPGGYTYEH